jgi:2-methylcitrate dehydratase PrpD
MITEAIATFAATADARAFPDSARDIARLSLLDWSAVAVAGVGEPVSRIVRTMLADEAGAPQATVLGLDRRLPVRAAALANGATSHALDYDDTHFEFVGHPSVAVAPAVLALAEQRGASGTQLLDAFLVGVETAVRVGRWLGKAHYQAGFHQTATAGSFGAAAGCARLLGLGVAQTRYALGIAATRASGLKSQFGTMGKPYHAGMASANGVEAASLAALGFESRPDGLECEQGFGETHAGENLAAQQVLEGLGTVFRFERVQYKYHACCHATHASLEALQAIRRESALGADEVAGVRLRVHPRWLRVCNIASPATGLEAKFSYRLTAAMMLAGLDTGALSTFSDDACTRADLVRLRDRVVVETDAAMGDTEVLAQVDTAARGTLSRHLDLDAAMPVAVQRAKLQAKAAGLLGPERGAQLWSVVCGLDTQPAATLAAWLARAAGAARAS